jgi:hypothetical protein
VDDNQTEGITPNEEDGSVEIEKDDPAVLIDRPFDPEKIKVKTMAVVVNQIVSRIGHDEIDLAPDFQRLRGVWDAQRKSRLIESLLLRIPLPVFYVAADAQDNWAVVDGLQRMSTIFEYVNDEYNLNRLEYLTTLEGKNFSALPRPMQRRIDETQLVVNVIEQGTPEEVMFNIFSRINTGGMRLNGQEIRHAMHKGPVRDYVKTLAQRQEFLIATDYSVKSLRMSDRECVLRFLAFYIEPWEQYNANDLDGFLGKSMQKLNHMKQSERQELEDRFVKAMNAAAAIFGDDAFRKRYRTYAARNPVSKALFEAWSVQLARCNLSQLETLAKSRDALRASFIELMNDDRAFDVSISYSTGVPQRVQKRFSSIKGLVERFVIC